MLQLYRLAQPSFAMPYCREKELTILCPQGHTSTFSIIRYTSMMSKEFDMGLQALYAGNLDKAKELLSKAIENDSLNAEAYFQRGKVHRQLGNNMAAMNDFYKTIDIDPSHNQAKISLEMVKQIMAFRNPDLYNS
ncbi:MAG TPA: tetratricopeptide repeat protein [Bacteroidetes bacterium]|nr:tetratricopeptide repeat protein [Bacteroidota bacterium]